MLNARHSVVHPGHASRNVTTVTWSAQATLVIVNSGVFPEHAHSSAMPDAAYNYAMMESVLARRQVMRNGFCRDIIWSYLLYFRNGCHSIVLTSCIVLLQRGLL